MAAGRTFAESRAVGSHFEVGAQAQTNRQDTVRHAQGKSNMLQMCSEAFRGMRTTCGSGAEARLSPCRKFLACWWVEQQAKSCARESGGSLEESARLCRLQRSGSIWQPLARRRAHMPLMCSSHAALVPLARHSRVARSSGAFGPLLGCRPGVARSPLGRRSCVWAPPGCCSF